VRKSLYDKFGQSSDVDLCYLITSHTLPVVRECFKGDEASQWERPKFDPLPHQNPLTDLHKNWQA